MISIVIPVYNEEKNINSIIENIFKLKSGIDFEIIVVDGNNERNTINKIKNKNVIKITSEKGRANQMNEGSKVAKGNILLFLHADTILPPKALENINIILNKKDVIAGAFDLGIDSNKFSYRLIEKMVFFRSRILKLPYGDQAIFVNKKYFEKIGRFKKIPLMEDVSLVTKISKDKYKISIIHHKVKTSARRWEKEGVIYCTLRNWLLLTLFKFGVSPNKLIKFYK